MTSSPFSIQRIEEELEGQTPVDTRVLRSVREAMTRLLPKHDLADTKGYFLKSSVFQEKPRLEVAVLTQANFLFDFTFTLETRHIYSLWLGPQTVPHLEVFYSYDTDAAALGSDIAPYRADLKFSGDSLTPILSYSAEGSRALVKRLIDFAYACISASSQAR